MGFLRPVSSDIDSHVLESRECHLSLAAHVSSHISSWLCLPSRLSSPVAHQKGGKFTHLSEEADRQALKPLTTTGLALQWVLAQSSESAGGSCPQAMPLAPQLGQSSGAVMSAPSALLPVMPPGFPLTPSCLGTGTLAAHTCACQRSRGLGQGTRLTQFQVARVDSFSVWKTLCNKHLSVSF